jgi:hypothetical protein
LQEPGLTLSGPLERDPLADRSLDILASGGQSARRRFSSLSDERCNGVMRLYQGDQRLGIARRVDRQLSHQTSFSVLPDSSSILRLTLSPVGVRPGRTKSPALDAASSASSGLEYEAYVRYPAEIPAAARVGLASR